MPEDAHTTTGLMHILQHLLEEAGGNAVVAGTGGSLLLFVRKRAVRWWKKFNRRLDQIDVLWNYVRENDEDRLLQAQQGIEEYRQNEEE